MFRIERATARRMCEVAKVFKTSRRNALPYLPELHSEAEDAHYFAQIVFPAMDVFVALDSLSQEVVGFIAFAHDCVHHLYLLPEVQRVGAGGRLLEIAKEGAEVLDLWVFQRNHAAQAFYAKHGFKNVAQTDGAENEEREPDLLMRWTKG